MAEMAEGTARLNVDASGAEAGFADAKNAAKSYDQAIKQTGENVARSMAATGSAAASTATKQDAATKRLLATIRRYDEAIGKSRGELLEYRAVQAGIFSGEVAQQIGRIKESEKAVLNLGMSAKQTAAAMRLLPVQITDITTSLASGMPIWLVAIQQGGQIKDSFGGIVPALKAVTGLFTPFRVAVGVASAAVGGLAAAYMSGEQESSKFRQSLILTGNISGTTAGQLTDMARRISALGGTQSQAAGALDQLVATGRFTATQLESIGLAAVQMERVTGRAVQDTVKEFVELAKSPVQASERLNETYHYLTASVYEQIRALEDQGRTQDAARVAIEAFASATTGRAQDMTRELGFVERAWKGIKDAASGALDAVKNIGRPDTLTDQIRAAEEQVKFLQGRLNSGRGRTGTQGNLEAARARLDALQTELRESERFSRQLAEQNQKREQGVQQAKALADFQDKYATKAQKITDEIAKWKNLIGDKFTSEMEGQIRAKIDRSGPKDDEGTRILIRLREQESSLRAQLDTTNKLTQAEKERAEVVRTLEDLRRKPVLTRDQSSILANADAIRKQLDANVAIAREVKLRDESNKTEEEFQRILVRSEEADKRLMERRLENPARARQAAEDYYTAMQRAQSRELEGVTASDFDRRRLSGRQQIEDRYLGQFQLLDRDLRRKEITKDEYDAERLILLDFQSRSLSSWEEHYQKLDQIRGDSNLGAEKALNDYLSTARDRFSQTQSLMETGFSRLEDAVVKFATTGKLSFSDFAQSVMAEMARMATRQLALGLFSAFGGGRATLPAGSLSQPTYDLPRRAGGGSVNAGTPYMVGERGREVFVPNASGRVVPNDALGGVTIHQTVNFNGGQGQGNPREMARLARESTEGIIADSRRRNGAVARL